MNNFPTYAKLDEVWNCAMERDAKLVRWHMDHTTFRELQKEDRNFYNFSYDNDGNIRLRGMPITFHASVDTEQLGPDNAAPMNLIAKREPFMISIEMKNRLDRSFYVDHADCHKEWKREGRDE